MTTQDIATRIMQHMARLNAKPDHAFGIHQLYHTLFSRANPKEQDLIEPAIQSLVEQQLITVEDRHGKSLVLTQRGYEQLYPLEAGAGERLGQVIMSRFAKRQSRPGHALDARDLQFNVIDKLNPKEQELLPAAIEALVSKGWVTQEKAAEQYLVLTQAGYDVLY